MTRRPPSKPAPSRVRALPPPPDPIPSPRPRTGRRINREALAPGEEQILNNAVMNGTESVKRRARAMLAWNEGLSAPDAARRVGLTENQVNYLWRMYKSKGIDLYLVDDQPLSTEKIPPPNNPVITAPAITAEATTEQPAVTIDTLIDQYHIDMKHARHVADLALQLFDLSVDLHRLPENFRPLLEAGAILHNIAVEIDEPKHHTRGRDLIMAAPLANFSDEDRQVIALQTAFHRKKVKPDSEPLYSNLPESLKRPTLALSALLRVADGLDYNGTQATQITDFAMQNGSAILTVEGVQSEPDSAQALKKADLWEAVFAIPLQIQQPPEPTLPARILPETVKVDAKMSLSRSGRIFVGATLAKIGSVYDDALIGKLPALATLAREAVRLLSALDLADMPEQRADAEWLIEPADDALLSATVLSRLAGLGYLGNDDTATRQKELTAALKALDPKRYSKFQTALMAASLENPTDQALAAHKLGPLLWGKLTELRQVMEFGNSVEEALRAVQRLEDHLLALQDLLGAELSQVMDMLLPLENYLSAIYSAQAVIARLEPKPIKRGRGKPVMPPPDPAANELRRAQLELVNMLADGLPGAWNAVNSDLFRRAFGLAIAAT